MTDTLKSTIDRARAAGMDLSCGTCAGAGFVELDQPWEHYKATCPACDGTGYPSAAEVLMWLMTSGHVRRGELMQILRCAFPLVSGGCGKVDVGLALRLTLDAAGVP